MNLFVKEFSISKLYYLNICWIVWIKYIWIHIILKLEITMLRISNVSSKLVLGHLRFKYTYNKFLLFKTQINTLKIEVDFIYFTS